jgi:hypothetical protein
MKDETLQSILNPKYDVDKQALVQEGLTKKLLHELQSVSAKADSKSDSKSESPASSQVLASFCFNLTNLTYFRLHMNCITLQVSIMNLM